MHPVEAVRGHNGEDVGVGRCEAVNQCHGQVAVQSERAVIGFLSRIIGGSLHVTADLEGKVRRRCKI